MEYRSLDTEIVTRAAAKGEKEIVSFIASTSSPDRYGDIINQKGWSLEKFRKNPVILLNHNASQLPIGRGEVDVVDGQLMVDVEFDMGDPIAAEVARKTKAGFMSAVSVGFNAIESTPRSSLPKDNPYYSKGGQYFESAELLEISIVTIPANGEAVAAKNFTTNRLFKLSKLKHILDVEYDGDHVIVTYLLKPKDEERDEEDQEEIDEIEEEIDEEIEEEAEEEFGYDSDEPGDDKEDGEKKKNFLTNQERDFFALITNGDDSDE